MCIMYMYAYFFFFLFIQVKKHRIRQISRCSMVLESITVYLIQKLSPLMHHDLFFAIAANQFIIFHFQPPPGP